jgi:hypothetical protein
MKLLVASFDRPQVNSDAGGVLLCVLNEHLAVTAPLPDTRDPSRVRHTKLEIVRKRLYAIACDYEDGNSSA